MLIGGGVASARCARTLRRNGFGGSILLVGEEQAPPYNRPPLTKELLRDDAPDELLAAEPGHWYERHSVAVLTEIRVDRLDPDARTAALSDGRTVRFQRALVATGSLPRRLPVAGGEAALMVRTLADARALRAAALRSVGRDVVVVGGGLIGVEVASGLAALGLRPTIVERTPTLWAGAMGALLSAWAVQRLGDAGVTVRLGETVDAVDGDAAVVAGERLPAAFVVAGIGVVARDELARNAGITSDRGIVVGTDQRTSHAPVWAAGDVARVEGRGSEHWHSAREAGERAALSMLGADPAPVPAPWTFTEVAGVAVDVFGDGDGEVEVDHEEWLVDGSVIGRSSGGELRQLIVVGSAVPADRARLAVERRLARSDVAEFISAGDT